MRALHAEVVQQSQEVVAVRERDVVGARPPEAARVVADDAVALGERGHLLVPHPQVGNAGVDQRQGMSLALHLVGQAAAGHVEELGIDSWHGRRVAAGFAWTCPVSVQFVPQARAFKSPRDCSRALFAVDRLRAVRSGRSDPATPSGSMKVSGGGDWS